MYSGRENRSSQSKMICKLIIIVSFLVAGILELIAAHLATEGGRIDMLSAAGFFLVVILQTISLLRISKNKESR